MPTLLFKDDFFEESLRITRYTDKGAAEQKARSTYEYLIDLAEDPAVLALLRFLRKRKIVHCQRLSESAALFLYAENWM